MKLIETGRPYAVLFDVFFEWHKEGKITFSGEVRDDTYCQADVVLLEFFDCPTGLIDFDGADLDHHALLHKSVRRFEQLDQLPDWILSPHAYAIFRAKLAVMRPELHQMFGLAEEACQFE